MNNLTVKFSFNKMLTSMLGMDAMRSLNTQMNSNTYAMFVMQKNFSNRAQKREPGHKVVRKGSKRRR